MDRTIRTPLELKLLGTGAADYDWTRFGQSDVRGSTSSLLNGHILLDCGATGLGNLDRFGIPYSAVDTLLVTHSHDDHFEPEQISVLAAGRRKPLDVYASPEALAMLPDGMPVVRHPLSAGMKFALDDIAVTVLPANHPTNIPGETAFHFCFEAPTGNLLYALDGAWMLKAAVWQIRHICFDWVVLDCTMADAGDWRIFEHTDVEMAAHMVKSLRNLGIVGDSTRIVLDHFARTLWPDSEEERRRKVAGTGFELAFDDMELRLE